MDDGAPRSGGGHAAQALRRQEGLDREEGGGTSAYRWLTRLPEANVPNIYDNIDVHLLSTLQVGLSATRKHGPAT